MTDVEEKASRYSAEAQADDEWKRQEAKLIAWKARIQYMWGLRKVLAVLLLFSILLLYLDKEQTGIVIEGAMVVVSVYAATYHCLPNSPQQQSKKLA